MKYLPTLHQCIKFNLYVLTLCKSSPVHNAKNEASLKSSFNLSQSFQVYYLFLLNISFFPKQKIPNDKSFCLFGEFLPSRSDNYYWNFPNRNVDGAILNFSFGKNQIKARFWFPVQEVFMLIPLKHGLHAVKIKTMRWETFKLWYLSSLKINKNSKIRI